MSRLTSALAGVYGVGTLLSTNATSEDVCAGRCRLYVVATLPSTVYTSWPCIALAVLIQTVSRTNSAFPRNRYRKSTTHY